MVTLERNAGFVEAHASVSELLNSFGPPSLADFRAKNIEKFASVGLPTTKDEEFKYLPLHGLSENTFSHPYGSTVDPEAVAALPYSDAETITLTFVNGEYAPELSNVSGLPNGARVMSLQEALEAHEGLVLRHLGKIASHDGKLGSTNDERFVWLNSAFLSEGAYIFVSKGVSVERPIHLRFVNRADHGAFAAHPRVLIDLEEGAQAKIVETHQSLSTDQIYFVNGVTEAAVASRASLEHIKIVEESPKAIHIANVFVHQEGNSVYTSTQVVLDGAVCRTDLNAYVDGEHAETWLNGAYIGLGEQMIDNHTRIDHAKPNCQSFEVYKGVLGGHATGVFNGKIFVYEDAQKTDAKQTNKALLLSPTATINTKPQLEIFADDVKCTHGATVGQIQDEELFYLRTRGIPEAEARSLLVYAFAAEVLNRVSIQSLHESLEAALYSKFKS